MLLAVRIMSSSADIDANRLCRSLCRPQSQLCVGVPGMPHALAVAELFVIFCGLLLPADVLRNLLIAGNLQER